MIKATPTLGDAITQYEAEHAFARKVTLPMEDRELFKLPIRTQDSGYRWFRSPNVVCLEKYRRLRTAERI